MGPLWCQTGCRTPRKRAMGLGKEGLGGGQSPGGGASFLTGANVVPVGVVRGQLLESAGLHNIHPARELDLRARRKGGGGPDAEAEVYARKALGHHLLSQWFLLDFGQVFACGRKAGL